MSEAYFFNGDRFFTIRKAKQLKMDTFSGIWLSGKLDSFIVNVFLTQSTMLDPDLIISRADLLKLSWA